MLELHDLDHGTVSDDCLCTAGSVVNPSPLPPDCLSPSGTDCTWYSRCLAVQYQCDGQAGYALGYGEKFCKIYEQKLQDFSADGQIWVGAVRKCLQVQLAPVLRFCSQPAYTCDQVKQFAFSTHAKCYLDPYQGLSVCNLTCYDLLEIFFTIHSSLESALSESLIGFWKVVLGCNSYYVNCWALVVAGYDFQVLNFIATKLPFIKRSVSLQDVSEDEIANAIVQSIASQLDWADNNSIAWFAYASNTTTDDHSLSIQLLIADTVKLGLVTTSNSTQLGLNGTLLQLIDITIRSLVITLTDLNLKFALTSLVACTPYDLSDGCRNGTLLAGTLPPPENNAFTTSENNVFTTTTKDSTITTKKTQSGTLLASSTPPLEDNAFTTSKKTVFTTSEHNAFITKKAGASQPTHFLPIIIANILVFFFL